MTGLVQHIVDGQADMVAWRHHLHAHPELAFEERETAAFIAARLEEWGLEVHRGLAVTGVVGVLRGQQPGDGCIGVRADMDALAMSELADNRPHISRYAGRMHGCGHDGHMTMLLGAARHLAATRNFAGTVVFIFQPGEEGQGGARRMVEEGLFTRFPCDRVFGLHNWPDMPVGIIGVRTGPIMAAADEFEIQVRGKGGHGAMPHHGVDPVLVAAHIITAVQSLVSRGTDPLDSAVVSITTLHGGTAFNVIPATVTLTGTARALLPETRQRLEQQLERIVTHTAAAFGATAEVVWRAGYPVTINSPAESEMAAAVAVELVGATNVVRDPRPSMGAEDFAYMLQARPGCYIWLGQGSAEGCMVHNPRYDFNDAVLPLGASYWVRLVERVLACA